MTSDQRRRLIARLVQFDLSVQNYAVPADRDAFFTMLLRDGFPGYENMTDDELRDEAYSRAIEDEL